MAQIELTDVTFYRNGASGASRIVGNEMGDSSGRRVARYVFTAPTAGANRENLTFHISGISDGSAVPLRFYIGTDPNSHANAGAESPYTGELTAADDYLSFAGNAAEILLPGHTYYLWVFPATDAFGYYSWGRQNFVSVMDTEGAAFLIPLVRDGHWASGMLHVIHLKQWWIGALCVVKDGKWHFGGGPN